MKFKEYLEENVKPSNEVEKMIRQLGLTYVKPYKRGMDGKLVDSVYKGTGSRSDIKLIDGFFPDFKVDHETGVTLSGHSKNGLFTYSYTEGDADIQLFKNKKDLMDELKKVAQFNKEQ